MAMGRYENAETQFVLALQTRYGYLIQPNNNTDYYGRPLKSSTMVAQKDAVNFLAQSPEDRLHAIRDTSPGIIAQLCLLADVYSKSGKYPQAAAYYKKALQCIYELYGDGAVVLEAGQMLNNLGINYTKSGEYYQADECYNRARAIYTELQPESLDYAHALYNQGVLHHKHLKDSEKAESLYREALTIYTKLDPSNQSIPKVQKKLSELAQESTITSTMESGPETSTSGIVSRKHKNKTLVTNVPKKMFQTMNPGGDKSFDSGTDITKAQYCNNHGVLYAEMKQLDDAEECFNQALALYKRQSTQSIGMAHVLYNLACLYSDFLIDKRTKSCLEEALDIYTTLSPDHPNIKTIRRMLGGTSGISDTVTAISSNQALQSLSPAQDTITSEEPKISLCN